MDLKTMLDAKAEEMRLDPHIPPSVLQRARRRRAGNAVLTGAVTVGLALGAFVGARTLLDETTSAPPEIRPGGTTEEFYPFIYPPTLEELEVTREQVAQGSMPMWTEPEGVAILFAVNVMGWEMDDVLVEVQGDTAEIRNPTLPAGARLRQPVATTLHLLEAPGSNPPIYAVMAAQADGLELEPIGPDEAFGANGRIGFRGSLGFIPEDAFVALTVNGGNPVFAPAPNGVFEVEAPAPEPLGPSTLISLAVLDGSRNTLALTSSRIATPVAGETAAGESEPQPALPAPVAEARDAILTAVQARDWEALRALIPDEGFTFTFGGEEDPIAYWQRLEEEGVPVLPNLETLLEVPHGRVRGAYIWPAPAGKDSSDWTEKDLAILDQLAAAGVLTERENRDYQELGYYYGWRVGIDRRGTWLFFVAGD
ncbi:MAG TPA: hypothetical protein VFZ45_04655 [Actinomycetota bacterium]|nr:hypothetical protein [Actinomycetota bacterium]